MGINLNKNKLLSNKLHHEDIVSSTVMRKKTDKQNTELRIKPWHMDSSGVRKELQEDITIISLIQGTGKTVFPHEKPTNVVLNHIKTSTPGNP